MTAQSVTPTLAATRRAETGRQVKALRSQGVMPAVMYGHNKESLALSVDQKTFAKLYNEVGGSTLVALKVDDDAPVKVLIHEVEVSPLRNEALHADFYVVNLKEKLKTEVELVFEGTSEAVEILGGTLITIKDVVEVECFPDDLVSDIKVDLSKIKTFEDTLTVADLVVPDTITILDEPEQTLVSVTEPRTEEEMAALDEAVDGEVKTEFETEDGVKEGEAAEGAEPEGEKKEAE
jgi:large subunit ribosomal protein L25